MPFTLDVDLDQVSGDGADELGRILRYRAGNLTHDALAPGDHEAVRDSAYAEVGS